MFSRAAVAVSAGADLVVEGTVDLWGSTLLVTILPRNLYSFARAAPD